MFRKTLVLVTLSLSLTGCSLVQVVDANHSNHGMQHGNSDMSSSDLMFSQMMIPHHQQAIEMSKLAQTRAESPLVKDLAEQILAEQGPEIDLMTSWLTEAGQKLTDHSMHGHSSGMLTEEQLQTLAGLKGNAFDNYFLDAMIDHHKGAVLMAKDALITSNPDLQMLLERIIDSQNDEIAVMKQLLVEIN
ncbi:MAG: DUF305 domain-containing protein [Acidobacteria bacterium]|nr:DUF305 domain-containing protein [Acidobacteriota bacterium]